jgi:hypothetical protein
MRNTRIFIVFATEDEQTKSLFTGQAKNKRITCEFVDMPVKEPWDEEWKNDCQIKIIGCDGAMVLVSKKTKKAAGPIWEIDCVKEEKIPLMGFYIGGATTLDKPESLNNISCKEWSWENVKEFIARL